MVVMTNGELVQQLMALQTQLAGYDELKAAVASMADRRLEDAGDDYVESINTFYLLFGAPPAPSFSRELHVKDTSRGFHCK